MSKRFFQYILLAILLIAVGYLIIGATDKEISEPIIDEMTALDVEGIVMDYTIEKRHYQTALQRTMTSLKNDPDYSDVSVSFSQDSLTQVVAVSVVAQANEMGSVSCHGSGHVFTNCCIGLFGSRSSQTVTISYYKPTDTFWAQEVRSFNGSGC